MYKLLLVSRSFLARILIKESYLFAHKKVRNALAHEMTVCVFTLGGGHYKAAVTIRNLPIPSGFFVTENEPFTYNIL